MRTGSSQARGQFTTQERYGLRRTRERARRNDCVTTGTPKAIVTEEGTDEGRRKKKLRKRKEKDLEINQNDGPVLVGHHEPELHANSPNHQVTHLNSERAENSVSELGSIAQDNTVEDIIITQGQRSSLKRNRSTDSVDIGTILQSKPHLEYLVILMKESLAAKRMEMYHLYTLGLLAEISEDVEKSEYLCRQLPDLSREVLSDIISDKLLREIKRKEKEICTKYPTSKTDDQGLGWEQWSLIVRGVDKAMKKNGTAAGNKPDDVPVQPMYDPRSNRSHIKFQAYHFFAVAHPDLVKKEEKWLQEISHSVFAAAGRERTGGHQSSWKQTYKVESEKELSDLQAKVEVLQKDVKDKDTRIKSILEDQEAKSQIQEDIAANNRAIIEQKENDLREEKEKASRYANGLQAKIDAITSNKDVWEEEVRTRKQQIDELRKSLQTSEVQWKRTVAERDENIQKAELELDRMKKLERAHDAKRADSDTLMARKQAVISGLETKLAELEDEQLKEREALIDTNKSLKAQVAKITVETDVLKEKLDFLKRKNTQLLEEDNRRLAEMSEIHKNNLNNIDHSTQLKLRNQKIKELEGQLQEKQDEANNAEKERKAAIKNIEDVKQKEKDLARDLCRKDEEVKAIQRKLDDGEKERQVSQKRVSDIEEKYNTVLKEVEEQKKDINKMRLQSEVKVKNYQEGLSNKEQEVEDLLKQVNKLEEKTKHLEAELLNTGDTNSEKFNKLQTEFINLSKERDKSLANQQELEKELKTLQKNIENGNKAAEIRSKEKDGLIKEAEDKEREHIKIEQKLKAQLSSVLNEIKGPEEKTVGAEHDLDISTAVYEVSKYLQKSLSNTKGLEERLAKAEEGCLINVTEIEDKDSKFSKAIEDMKEKVCRLEEQLNNAQSECQEQISAKIKVQQELSSMKRDREQGSNDKTHLEAQIARRKAEVVRVKEQNESLKNKIHDAEVQVNTLKKQYDEMQLSVCRLQKQLKQVEKEKEEALDKVTLEKAKRDHELNPLGELRKKLKEVQKKLQDEEAKSQAVAEFHSQQLKEGEAEQEALEKEITNLRFEADQLRKDLTEAIAQSVIAQSQASQQQTSGQAPSRPVILQTKGSNESDNVGGLVNPKTNLRQSPIHITSPSSCDTVVCMSPKGQGESQSHSLQRPSDPLLSTPLSSLTISSDSGSPINSPSSFISWNSSNPSGEFSPHDSGPLSPRTPCPAKQHTRKPRLDPQGVTMNPDVQKLLDSANARNIADSTGNRRNVMMQSRTRTNNLGSVSKLAEGVFQPFRPSSDLVRKRASQGRDSQSNATSIKAGKPLVRHSPGINMSTHQNLGSYLDQSNTGRIPFEEHSTSPWHWNSSTNIESLLETIIEQVNFLGGEVTSLKQLSNQDTNTRMTSEPSNSDEERVASPKKLSTKDTNKRKTPESSDSDEEEIQACKRPRRKNNVSSGTQQPTTKSVIKSNKAKQKKAGRGKGAKATVSDTTEEDSLLSKVPDEDFIVKLDNQNWPILRIKKTTTNQPRVILADDKGEERALTLLQVLSLGTKETCEKNTLHLLGWYIANEFPLPDSLAFVTIEAISRGVFRVGFNRKRDGTTQHIDGMKDSKLLGWGYRAAALMGEDYVTKFQKKRAAYIENAKRKLQGSTKE